jgi:DNA-binding NtrC family response regulator
VGSNKITHVDIRIIATSNKDLPQIVQKGEFREDLYFRLNVVPIHIPPLSERREDIPFLADFFLKKFAHENQKEIAGFSRDAMRILRQYPYPGNARELQNIVERAVVLCSDRIIEPRDLAMNNRYDSSVPQIDSLFSENMTLGEIEKRAILNYLRKTGGNRSQVARILNVSVRTIRNKLLDYKKEGIHVSNDGVITYTNKEEVEK